MKQLYSILRNLLFFWPIKGKGIIVGDFTWILDRNLDRLPIDKGPKIKKVRHLRGWWRNHLRERAFTFMTQMHGSYSKINFFSIWKKYLYKVEDSKIEPITTSDHHSRCLGSDEHLKYWRLQVVVAVVCNNCLVIFAKIVIMIWQ